MSIMPALSSHIIADPYSLFPYLLSMATSEYRKELSFSRLTVIPIVGILNTLKP